jgi:hypothetical protein
MGMFYSCPRQETVAVVEGFGKFSRVAYPGKRLRILWGMIRSYRNKPRNFLRAPYRM